MNADDQDAQIASVTFAQRLDALPKGEPINILAISGGGAGGAFGAGAIVGLTRSGQRPEFAVVTGVSAGALIAPYAFLGPAWDRELSEIYTTGVGEHVLQSRGLGAVFGSSLFRGSPLRQLVDRYATDDLIDAVAREAGKGRLLLIATTDFDTAEPIVWDLGAIAMHGGPEAKALFRDVLVASASVPGMFPPVVIRVRENGARRDETHVDGGVTTPFFVAPIPQEIAHDMPGGPGNVGVYVLIDGQLSEAPRATPLRTTAIVSRSVSAGLSRMLRTTLELTAASAEQRGIPMDYAAIPAAYPFRGAFDFRSASVRPLFQYGYDCATAGRLWTEFRHSPADDATVSAESSAQDLKCPADDAFIERFAESRH